MKGALGRLVPAIMGWLAVIITLALAPTIETYNGYVSGNLTAATNATYFVGLSAIQPWGGFIMVMILLTGTGIFAFSGMKTKNVSVGDLVQVIGAVIVSVFALAVFSGTIIGNIDDLITAGASAVKNVYGALGIIIYALIIGGAGGFAAVKAYRGSRRSRRSTSRMF